MIRSLVRHVFVVPALVGVVAFVGFHAASAPAATAAPTESEVRTIYLGDCAVCHGADGAGTQRGPSLLDSGRAGVDFYLTTGRMPIPHSTDAIERRKPAYD